TRALQSSQRLGVTQPSFLDNQDGNTVARGLRERIDWLTSNLVQPVTLTVATGYFNPGGFAQLADVLQRVGHVRLLLGAEPPPTLNSTLDNISPRFRGKLKRGSKGFGPTQRPTI